VTDPDMTARDNGSLPEEFDEAAPIAEDEVISAARSCSAILVIILIVAIVTCVMVSIAVVYD
jgi:type IV secretory pathway component VirB8